MSIPGTAAANGNSEPKCQLELGALLAGAFVRSFCSLRLRMERVGRVRRSLQWVSHPLWLQLDCEGVKEVLMPPSPGADF